MRVNEIPVQQAAAAKVTRPLPSLAERGVAPRETTSSRGRFQTDVVTNEEVTPEIIPCRTGVSTFSSSRVFADKDNNSVAWEP